MRKLLHCDSDFPPELFTLSTVFNYNGVLVTFRSQSRVTVDYPC